MYIYRITNLVNNKIYIGQCSRKPEESKEYFGSGLAIKKALAKHGIDNFRKEILISDVFNRKLLDKLEIGYIELFGSKSANGYNLTIGGGGVVGNVLSDEQKAFISKRTKEGMTEEVRQRLSNSLKGNIPWNVGLTASSNNKIKEAEEKRKISNAKYLETHSVWNKGIPASREAVEKQRKSLLKYYENNVSATKGVPVPEDRKEKIRKTCKEYSRTHANSFLGKRHTTEAKTMMSSFHKGKTPCFDVKEEKMVYISREEYNEFKGVRYFATNSPIYREWKLKNKDIVSL